MYNRSSVCQAFFAFWLTVELFDLFSPLLLIMRRNISLNALESKLVVAELNWFVSPLISEARRSTCLCSIKGGAYTNNCSTS